MPLTGGAESPRIQRVTELGGRRVSLGAGAGTHSEFRGDGVLCGETDVPETGGGGGLHRHMHVPRGPEP